MSSQRIRRFAARLALATCGTAFALGLVELIGRATYVKPWHLRLVEEQQEHRWNAGVWRNRFGLRDRDYATPKPPHTRRVLMLGDSFTYGYGVADNHAVFPELLEQRLDAEFSPQAVRIEVLNGGIPASLTHQWVELLEQVKDSFQPDVVLIVFFLRDGTRTASIDGFFGPIRDELRQRDRDSWAYRHSFAFRALRESHDRLQLARKYAQAFHDAYFGTAEQTQEWANARRNLLRIREIAEGSGAAVGLVVFPLLVELDASYPFRAECEAIMTFAAENYLPAHNLLPAFLGRSAPDLWVSSYDQHPNVLGHAIAAEAIAPFLRQLLVDAPAVREVPARLVGDFGDERR